MNLIYLSNIQMVKSSDHIRFVPYFYNLIIEAYTISLKVYGFL